MVNGLMSAVLLVGTDASRRRFERESWLGVHCSTSILQLFAVPRRAVSRVARVLNGSLKPVANNLKKVARGVNTTSALPLVERC